MKNKILNILILFIIIELISNNINAQATFNNNNAGGAAYLGWDNTVGAGLNIKTEANQPINFYTNAGAGTLLRQRMIIDANGTNAASGYIGIGNNFVNPVSRLHVSQGGDVTGWFQLTGNNTGNTAADGFRLGVLNPSSGTYDVELRQQEGAPMKFFTGNNITGNHLERMMLDSGTFNDAFIGVTHTNVTRNSMSYGNAFGANASPWSILHLGQDIGTGLSRAWMNVGTSYTDNLDAGYIGMNRDTGSDQTDFVISWADNEYLEAGPDNLRFIFLANFSGAATGDPASREGRETGRFTPDGNFGVGNFYNAPSFQPARRIEALDMGSSNPQLRLTHTQATPGSITTTGRWTDFQTTSRGDLYIHPDSLNFDKRVGINISTPGNTLEINASASTFISPEPAGLRFTDLTNAATPITNPSRGVLSVDNDGDVIWVRDSIGTGTGSSNVGACIGSAEVNYVTKFTVTGALDTICNSQIYDNGTNVGIGMIDGPCNAFTTPCPPYKLTVNGSIAVGDTDHVYKMNTTGAYDRIFTCEGGSGNNTNVSAGVGAGPSTFISAKDYSVYVGHHAGIVDDGDYNTIIGGLAASAYTGSANAGGNTVVGYRAAELMTDGEFNTIAGANAARILTEGTFNVIQGHESGYDTDTLNSSVFIGKRAGLEIEWGINNVIIGANAGTNVLNASRVHATALGAESRVDKDSTVALGTVADYVAIGTATPRDSVRLTVNSHDTPKYHENAAVFNGRVGIYQYNDPTGNAIPLPVDSSVLTVRTISGAGGYNYAGFFVGPVPDSTRFALFSGGKILTTGGLWTPSDANLKTNIQPMGSVQSLFDPIIPYTYEFNNNLNSNLVLPQGTQGGFLASEIAASFPQLVTNAYIPAATDNAGGAQAAMQIQTVNIPGLIPYMFQAIKEQKEEIEALTAQVNSCCNTRTTGSEEFPVKQTIDLASSDPILYQNQPNPFDNTTIIRYFISENSKQPKIIFQDETGRTINETAITEMGQGSIQINAESLNSGIYTYSLQIDGKIIDSKKMLKSK